MVGLRMRDFKALNEAILILHSDHRATTLPARLQNALSTIVSADITAVECFDKKVWTGRMLADPAPLVERHFPAFLRECASHPLFPLFVAGQLQQPLRISDIISQRSLRDRPIFTEFLRPLGVDRQMAVAMQQPDGSAAVMVWGRKGQDFSESEKLLLATFVPHVISVQPQKTRNRDVEMLPVSMVPLLKAQLGITKHEAHVVYWLARGKTDLEIGLISRISKRTVQKHCENIYRKLGVECRTAAVVKALESCL